MSQAYYYFCASLPLINDIEDQPPITVEEFLNDCERLLAKEDNQLIVDVFNDEPEIKADNETVKQYLIFDQDFRNEIAFYRAERARKDPSDHLRGTKAATPSVVERMTTAFKNENLLDSEKILDRIRFDALDHLLMGHSNDFEYIFLYGLKLQIVDRYKQINSPRGKELFEEYKNIEIPEESSV